MCFSHHFTIRLRMSAAIQVVDLVSLSHNLISDLLCPLLKKTFGALASCTTPKNSFIHLPVLSERFASSSAYQYHNLLPSLRDLVTYIQHKVCADETSCKTRSKALNSADYLDIDYDTISQSITISAFWHIAPGSGKWDERIESCGESVKVEVGVLANEKATQPEELSLGGFLAVLGEDKKFSMPSNRIYLLRISANAYKNLLCSHSPLVTTVLPPLARIPPSSYSRLAFTPHFA